MDNNITGALATRALRAEQRHCGDGDYRAFVRRGMRGQAAATCLVARRIAQ